MERAELERLVNGTGCAERHGDTVFLCDPHWSETQRAVFARLIQSTGAAETGEVTEGWLAIATGGSSGGLRFARHDEGTLGAAAGGFARHFGLPKVNAIDVLPPWHVSGLLARARCAVTGGTHRAWTWKQLENGDRPALPGDDGWVISLVPTQLQRLLGQPEAVAWLRQLRLILIGGGPVWPDLMDATVAAKLPVVLSYGMTETAAMVAAQVPPDFAAGDRSSGRGMPQARISIRHEVTGAELPAGQAGVIHIEGPSVMRGYAGGSPANGLFVTADLGWLDEAGRLHVLGRRDDVIITGGEKVNPREIEAVLRATGHFEDLAIVGLPDPAWGEIVAACYVSVAPNFDPSDLGPTLGRLLSGPQRPKRWVRFHAADWPRNAQGKINRAALKAAASAARDPRG